MSKLQKCLRNAISLCQKLQLHRIAFVTFPKTQISAQIFQANLKHQLLLTKEWPFIKHQLVRWSNY